MEDYEKEDYQCFNDCFTRHIRKELRPVDMEPEHLIAPCDGLLSIYPIRDGLVVPIKQSRYSIRRLLHSKKLAEHYQGGMCLVFRLCVNHYHRYAYMDHGMKGDNHFIPGVLHTVQPIALESLPVFTENCREYTVMKTENFGKVVQMEVGAMLVGKIANLHGAGPIRRGEEKGMFLYGGSTIVLLLEKDRVRLPQEWIQASERREEIPICMGQKIGEKIS